MSPTDPAAAWTTRGRHKVMFGYSLNYLIDMEHAVILDVEATPTRISKEVDATETMIERTEERFGLKPSTWPAMSPMAPARCSAGWSTTSIDPHIPVWDKSKRAQRHVHANRLHLRRERGYLYLPGRQDTEDHRHGPMAARRRLYRASKRDCDHLPAQASNAVRSLPAARIPRDVNEASTRPHPSLDGDRGLRGLRGGRKKIETLFGEVKRNLWLVRLRLRGLTGARDEFLLTATVQNLKRLANHTTRPPPQPSAA